MILFPSKNTIKCPCYRCVVSVVCSRDRDCAAYDNFYTAHNKFCLPIYKQYSISDGEFDLEVVNFCSDITPDRFCPLFSPHLVSVTYTEDNVYFNMDDGSDMRLIDPQKMKVLDQLRELKDLQGFIPEDDV